ncbi:hypothetical protein [Dactylosporangium sp. NPDC048998]|uniref:hypothetical protein n=1 Tax=Dactylosporangium sp. NPDC048998 TaxID=3363976 RepID=UPI00371CD8B1
MSATTGTGRQFGEGPLSRVASFVYTLLVVELLLVATMLPGLAVLIVLDRDASNVPLAAACALPFGPALSAALYALHHRRQDLTELAPAPAFWRGYRANAVGVLKIWAPWLAFVTVVGVNLTHLSVAGIPRWWAVLLVVVAVVATLCAVNALVITSLFTFRAVDVARLACYFLVRTPSVALGNAGLLAVAATVTVLSSEAVLALAGSLLALALLRTSQPMTTLVREQFTA